MTFATIKVSTVTNFLRNPLDKPAQVHYYARQ